MLLECLQKKNIAKTTEKTLKNGKRICMLSEGVRESKRERERRGGAESNNKKGKTFHTSIDVGVLLLIKLNLRANVFSCMDGILFEMFGSPLFVRILE